MNNPASLTDTQAMICALTEPEFSAEIGGESGREKPQASRRFAAPEHPLMFINRSGKSRNLSTLERERMRRWVRCMLSGG